MTSYPLNTVKPLFTNQKQTFGDIGVKINPSLEGITLTQEMLEEKSESGLKKLISLEFNWLPRDVVMAYNSALGIEEKKKILIEKVYGNCSLNCKGCYVKNDNFFGDSNLIYPEKILDLIEEAVENLGTKTLKYLGPSEFFRDKELFKHLDRFNKMDVILNIFAKDPMLGSDDEVSKMFGDQGLTTANQFVKRLAKYPNLRILYNFRTFDDELTNDLVRDGYKGKKNFEGDYKQIQTRSLQLLYKYFVKQEINNGKEGRLVIVNTPIIGQTTDEAFEIFKYFVDRGVPVCSTTTMQSGCGGSMYLGMDEDFKRELVYYYAKATDYSIQRGMISKAYFDKYGPSPYAGMAHCMQLCSGLMIRSTGQLMRCPGADNESWRDNVSPQELLKQGLTKIWPKTKNYKQKVMVNVGCRAKPKIFTTQMNRLIQKEYLKLQQLKNN